MGFWRSMDLSVPNKCKGGILNFRFWMVIVVCYMCGSHDVHMCGSHAHPYLGGRVKVLMWHCLSPSFVCNLHSVSTISHEERVLLSQCFSKNDIIIKRVYKKCEAVSFISSTKEVTSKARRLGRGREERERRTCHIFSCQWFHHNGKLKGLSHP